MLLSVVLTLRVLIITGESDLPYHDWRQTTPLLRSLLTSTNLFTVDQTENPSSLTPALLSRYDVVILNYNGPRWGEPAEKALEQFLRSGKGMVAVHGVSYGPFYGQDMKTRTLAGQPWPEYAQMMGSTWKLENVGHSVRHAFEVRWTDAEHPIARGLAPFQADDELYHKMDLLPGAHVVASAYSDPQQKGTGRAEPMIWTVNYGRGRVVHITLGHDVKAMSVPGFGPAFTRAAEWAARNLK